MKTLFLVPQPVTPDLLEELEALGLIIRLLPGRHRVPAAHGEAIGRPVYPGTDSRHGGHLLLACTINQAGFQRFGWHEVPEEFLLLGPAQAAPLYLAVFRGQHGLLQEKIDRGELTESDFTCFQCAFNDPETSFFTMLPGVPHGEGVAAPSANPPSFYVTEPAGTTLLRPQWGDFAIRLQA